MIYSEKKINKMNSTARSTGAVGSNAIIVRIIKSLIDKDKKILDYGSGPNLVQTMQLIEYGFDVKSWEIGKNLTNSNYFIQNLKENSFDVVFASNVLNVQENENDIRFVINEVFDITKDVAIFNFPKKPNYSNMSTEKIFHILKSNFEHVFNVYRTTDKNFIYEDIDKIKRKFKTNCWICKKI